MFLLKLGKLLKNKPAGAATIAFLLGLLPLFTLPFGFFSSIIVSFITLSRGARLGAFVLAWSILPSVAFMVIHGWYGIPIIIFYSLFSWLFSLFFIRFSHWGKVTYCICALGCLFLLSLHIFFPELKDWWVGQIDQSLTVIQEMFPEKHYATAQVRSILALFSQFLTGLFLLLSFFWVVIFVQLAQNWLSVFLKQPCKRVPILSCKAHPIFLLNFLFLILWYFFRNPIFSDIFAFLCFPFFLSFISFLEQRSRKKTGIKWLLLSIYFGILLLPIVLILLLTFFGVCRTLVEFKNSLMTTKLVRKNTS